MQKLRKGSLAFEFTALSCVDRPALRPRTPGVGKVKRARIARARLDANFSPTAGEAENQDHIGLSRQQFWQIAVHGIIRRRKDMAFDLDPGERRPPPARQRGCQTPAWI